MRLHAGQSRQLSAREFCLNMTGMNLVFKTPDGAPHMAGKDFSVIISCDSATGERAGEVLNLLQKNLKREEGRLLYQLWNIETLAFIQLQELASVEAAKADMVIVGISERCQIFDKVVAWTNRWVNLRKGRPGALVAVLEADLKKPDILKGMLSQLKEAAGLGQMDFFFTGTKGWRDARLVSGVSEAARQFVMAKKPLRNTICRARSRTVPTQLFGSSEQVNRGRF